VIVGSKNLKDQMTKRINGPKLKEQGRIDLKIKERLIKIK